MASRRRPRDSLRRRLALWMAGVILTVALAAATWSLVFAFQEANELQDGQLRDTAGLLARLGEQHGPGWLQVNHGRVKLVAAFTPLRGGERPTSEALRQAIALSDGYHTVEGATTRWRVYLYTRRDGRRILVAQNTALRGEIARDGALRTLVPALALIPVLAALVTWLLRTTLRPLRDLSDLVDRTDGDHLEPLPEQGVPSEIQPFVSAINRLLGRLREVLAQQRRFVADAAHELRTPMTALALQADNLDQAALTDAARERLADLRAGLGRARRLIEQMLSLAQVQGREPAGNEAADMASLTARVFEQLMPAVLAKKLDLRAEGDPCLSLRTDTVALIAVLRNLLENAVHFAPAGGRVTVRWVLEGARLVVEVEDNGPGIPDAERERVFAPFYRLGGASVEGSGLGLAIVRDVALRVGGSIELHQAHPGLLARYTQPATASFENTA